MGDVHARLSSLFSRQLQARSHDLTEDGKPANTAVDQFISKLTRKEACNELFGTVGRLI